MRKLRYPLRIFTQLQFLLVFTGLLHSPAEPCLPGAQAIPVDGYRLQQISSVKVVDPLDHHQGTGPFKNSIGHHNDRSSATTDLPSVVSDDGQPRPSFAASPSGPLPFKLSGTTIQRLRPVVHETNKGILLTNGEQIKLYPLKESDLTPSGGYYVIQSKLNSTTNGWNRPLISDVGYVFDNRFCTSPNHTWIPKRNCLVIFWLDKKNKLFRYGSFMFTHPSRIELLSSKFNANGNLKSLSDKNKKTLLLDEFPPIDLCKRARELDYLLSDCAVSSMTIDRSKLELHVSLNVSATITSANSSQAKKYVTATMSAYIGKTLLDFQNIDISSNSKKNDIPDAIAMTENNLRCKYFWMNANYELYSSNLAGQDVQLIEKLSSKPAIRMLGEIHSYRDILFFSDMASKSIMSYNLTHRADINRQTKPRESRGRKKFEMVEKFESTHHVLLVETSTINKFSIMDLKEVGPWRTESVCKMQQAKGFEEPRVIDDNLSEHLRRQKLNLDYEQHLLEDIMQITLIVLSILLIIFIVTDKTRIKQVKPDRETFFNNNNVEP